MNPPVVPDVYVISLASAQSRRAYMRAQLDSPFVPRWRFIDAVSKAGLDADWIAARESGRTYASGKLTMSEHACLASHLATLRWFLDSDRDFAIILEDDATLAETFPEIAGALARKLDPQSDAVVVLNWTPLFYGWGRRKIYKRSYLCRTYVGHGAQGYLVTRASAARMLAIHNKVLVNPDDWTYLIANHGLDVRCMVPYVVSHGLLGRSSQLVHRHEASTPRRGLARVKGWFGPKWRDKHIKQRVLGVRRQPLVF